MARTTRILHVAETCKGGVASWMQDVLPALVTTFGKNNIAVLVPQSDAESFATIPGVKVFTYHRTGRGPASLLRFARAILSARSAFQPTIVHLQSTFAGLVGRIALLPWHLFKGLKIVYTAHGWAFSMAVSRRKQQVYAIIERTLQPFTNLITTISAEDHADALRHKLAPKNMVMLRNTCRALVDDPNTRTKQKAKHLTIAFVGRFDHQKGVDVLMQALQQLATTSTAWHARIVGEPVHGEPLQIPTALQNHIELCGWLSRPQLGKLLEESDVLVMPSRWEGFGLVALEAMSCGTAVIASRVGGLPEIVAHGTTGLLVNVDDATAIATALTTTPRTEWHTMGQTGLARYRTHFQPQAMQEELVRLYRTLA